MVTRAVLLLVQVSVIQPNVPGERTQPRGHTSFSLLASVLLCHSIEVGIKRDLNLFRLIIKASQTIITNPNTATKEIIEPIEDKTFHAL